MHRVAVQAQVAKVVVVATPPVDTNVAVRAVAENGVVEPIEVLPDLVPAARRRHAAHQRRSLRQSVLARSEAIKARLRRAKYAVVVLDRSIDDVVLDERRIATHMSQVSLLCRRRLHGRLQDGSHLRIEGKDYAAAGAGRQACELHSLGGRADL